LTGRLVPVKKLAVLAEADLLLSSIASAGYVGMLQGDYEIVQGVHAIVTGEMQDTGKKNGSASTTGAGQPQLGAWFGVGWFFFTHFDARFDLVIRQKADSFVASQIHYYF
jgi:hypothetical protein